MNKALTTVWVLSAMVAGPAAAGVVFQIETKDHGATPPTVQVIEVSAQGSRMAAEIGGSDNGSVIFDSAKGRMVVIDHAAKSYFALDKQQVTGMANQMSDMMAKALENVPEEQRAAVEQMMKQRMPQQPEAPEMELVNTGEQADKNGYPCVRYDLRKDGRKLNELWVTNWKNIEGAAEVAEAFGEMGDFVRDLTESFSKAMGGGGIGLRFGQDMFAQLSRLEGFPVQAREFGPDGTLVGESNLKSAQRRDIAPSAFEPPAGYQARSMFGG